MKILQLLFLVATATSVGQGEIPSAEKLYNDATAYYEVYNGGDIKLLPYDKDRSEVEKFGNEDYYFVKANENFKIIIQLYPLSPHYIEALYNVGHFEYVKSNFLVGKKYLEELINKNVPNAEYYKRQALFDLAEIAIYEEDLTLAQKYVTKMKGSKPKTLWCRNAADQDKNMVHFLSEKLILELSKQ